MVQGRVSNGVELIEVGPGRGTLMDDMLRVWYDAQTRCYEIPAEPRGRLSATSNR